MGTKKQLAEAARIIDKLGKPLYDYPEGTTAKCLFCGQKILLDQEEGGGPGKDWGDGPSSWSKNGGIGMDYGCGSHPLNDADGTYGHVPILGSIRIPTST